MSKGYFFELNQHLSAVEKGIAIFDYTELQAYDGAQKEDSETAKYPINMVITADAVCFKLHYFTYYHYNYGDNNKPISYHRYLDSTLDTEIHEGKKSHWDLTHVEDVILELPFTADATTRLVDIIKNSYNTEFPQRFSQEKNLYGYLERIIRNKYKTKTQEEPLPVPVNFYSSQWLMDIYDDSMEVNLYENNDPKLEITKFLRKLILDFMFDLKHSDVFKSSTHFQRMHTGLMSDYYFSSLMHKCEFFYYRDLIISEAEPIKEKTKDETKNNNKNYSFTYLYAKELFNAQELWTNDIMNPLSESYFEHDFPDWKVQFFSVFYEKLNAKKWNSWFATPEEEMRRVYFTMNEWGKPRNCNADTLTEFLDLNNKEDEGIKSMLAFQQENREKVSRWFLSRYDFNDVFRIHFIKLSNLTFLALLIILLCSLFFGGQYVEKSFPWLIDLIMKYPSSIGILAAILLIIRCLLSTKAATTLLPSCCQLYTKRGLEIFASLFALIFFILVGIKYFQWEWVIAQIMDHTSCIGILAIVLLIIRSILSMNRADSLLSARNQLRAKRLLEIGAFFCISIFFIAEGIKKEEESILFQWGVLAITIWCIAILLIPAFNLINRYLICQKSEVKPKFFKFKRQFLIHPFRNMHIILPKLYASITAAWLTLSTGYVIYISFFNLKVYPFIPIVITTIIISFTMSRISRTMPTASSRLLLFRAIDIAFISYSIALEIGVVAINFVGEKYLCQNESFKELKQEIAGISKNNSDTVKIEKVGDNIKYKAIRHDNIIHYYVSNKDKNGNFGSQRLFVVELRKTSQKYVFIMPDFLNNTHNEAFKELKAEMDGISKRGTDIVIIEKKGHNAKFKAIRHDNMIKYSISNKNKKGSYDREILFAVKYPIPHTNHDLFIMPEFLKMFSFIAMFIGIFLQMAFFDARQMTDF